MNAMAAQQAATRAAAGPEFVVIKDDGPSEEVTGGSRAVGIIKMFAIVIVPLIVGTAIGKIFENRARYNQTIADATALSTDVKAVRKSLVGLHNALLQAKQDGGYQINDPELLKTLETLKLTAPDRELAYRANLRTLKASLVTDIYDFYHRAGQLVQDVQLHIDETKRDADNLKRSVANLQKSKPGQEQNPYSPYRYGVYVQIPSSADDSQKKPFGAKLVELGAPLCQNDQPAQNGVCPGAPRGFRYRLRGGGGWGSKLLAQPEEGKVAKDNLLVLQRTSVWDTLLKGSVESLAEQFYRKRIENIDRATTQLMELGSSIESSLREKGKESPRFTL